MRIMENLRLWRQEAIFYLVCWCVPLHPNKHSINTMTWTITPRRDCLVSRQIHDLWQIHKKVPRSTASSGLGEGCRESRIYDRGSLLACQLISLSGNTALNRLPARRTEDRKTPSNLFIRFVKSNCNHPRPAHEKRASPTLGQHGEQLWPQFVICQVPEARKRPCN
jgi:hypothetical protein